MFTASNALSLLRAPLAILFLINRIDVRVVVICIAMLTDCVDGYLARRYKLVTRIGAVLDPLMDKFFVLFVICLLYSEGNLLFWQAIAIFSRDFAIAIFATYLLWNGQWKTYTVRAGIWGKITTAFQFFIILSLSLNFHLHSLFFYTFMLFGSFVLLELFLTLKTNVEKV